jgi:hypothetical protein
MLPLLLPVALAGGRDTPRRARLEIYLVAVVAVVFVIFSVMVTKFAHYQAVAVVPWAVLIGTAIDRLLREPDTPLARLSWVGATMFLLVPLIDLLRDEGRLILSTFTIKRNVPETVDLGPVPDVLLLLMAAVMLAGVVSRSRTVVTLLTGLAVSFALFNTAVFVPAISPSKTMKHLCEAWRKSHRADEPICFYGSMKHGINFYTGGAIERVKSLEACAAFLNPDRPASCIVERESVPAVRERCLDVYGLKPRVEHDAPIGYVLLGNHAP